MEYDSAVGDTAPSDDESGAEAVYDFAGFEIVSSVKVALTRPAPTGTTIASGAARP